MNLYVERLLHTPYGVIILSAILGLGMATLFRKACDDKNCLTFNGPVISEVQDKIFKHGDKCYTYTTETASCNNKATKVIDMSDKNVESFSTVTGSNYQSFK